MREITFVIEPDNGRLTIETSNAIELTNRHLREVVGKGTALNCARPILEKETRDTFNFENVASSEQCETINLFRLYHRSTTDGPGRRSVIQTAGCSIQCTGCFVPETHSAASGANVSVDWILRQIIERRAEHDGVTILGGEPFDQTESLHRLIIKLKENDFHLVIYTGRTLEALLERECRLTNEILSKADVLIDGAFDKSLATGAGEYRGSSNQRIIENPFAKRQN